MVNVTISADTVLAVVAGLARLRNSVDVAALKGDIEHLQAQLVPSLPAKPDGSPWTPEDVAALADRVVAQGQRIQHLSGEDQDD